LTWRSLAAKAQVTALVSCQPDPETQNTRDLGDFLTPTLGRQLEAEQALLNGDPGPRLAMWSAQDPVTVFGAEKSVIGSEEARQVFGWLATRFSNCRDYRFELVAAGASGDLASTLGYDASRVPWMAARSRR
jgi:hypothetical protein